MSTVFESCEQQFAQISAEVSSRINKISRLLGDERQTEVKLIEGNLDEAREQLEQMELEVADLQPPLKSKLSGRVKSYKNELARLQKEFKEQKVKVGRASDRRELLGSDLTSSTDEQKEKLLSNTDRLGRTGEMIDESYRITIESERVGMSVMDNLQQDRDKIQRTRRRLQDTNEDITKSGRILSRIGRRILQHKIIIVIGILVALVVIALIIFAIVKIKQSTDNQN
jgi:vesicle transport through interaction with t-SNAREs protein 1